MHLDGSSLLSSLFNGRLISVSQLSAIHLNIQYKKKIITSTPTITNPKSSIEFDMLLNSLSLQ